MKGLFIFLVVISVLFGPLAINKLMFNQSYFEVHGTTEDVWISSLSTFYGAILGGIISGFLTLIGVKLTLKHSNDELNDALERQQDSKKEELEYNSIKEQFYRLYHPLNSIITLFTFKYGAHVFTDLKVSEVNDMMDIIIKNDIFAEEELYIKFIELRGAHKEKEMEVVDEIYNEILTLVTDKTYDLKVRLGFHYAKDKDKD